MLRGFEMASPIVGLAALAFAGCSEIGGLYGFDDGEPASATQSSRSPSSRSPSSRIALTEGDIFDRPYRTLGRISVETNALNLFSGGDRDEVNELLREEAARLGADAVIGVFYVANNGGFLGLGDSMTGEGTAVSFIAGGVPVTDRPIGAPAPTAPTYGALSATPPAPVQQIAPTAYPSGAPPPQQQIGPYGQPANFAVYLGFYDNPNLTQQFADFMWKKYAGALASIQPRIVTSRAADGRSIFHLYGMGLTENQAQGVCFALQQRQDRCAVTRI